MVGTLYVPGEGACWRCMRTALFDEDPTEVPLGHVHMATAATCGMAGSLAAHLALAQLTGVARPTPGETVVWSTVRLGHAFTLPVEHRPDCPDCRGG